MITVAVEEEATTIGAGAGVTTTGRPGVDPVAVALPTTTTRTTIPTVLPAPEEAMPTDPPEEGVVVVVPRNTSVVGIVAVVVVVVAAAIAAGTRGFPESPCWCATLGPTSPTTISAWPSGASEMFAMFTSRETTTRSKRRVLRSSSTRIQTRLARHATKWTAFASRDAN